MRTIPKERILRVNCAGYGTEAHWNLGRAKSLNNYSAIIVNPVSIAHLFDKDPELVRKVEQCLAEGNTTLTIDDDLLLRNLAAEIDSRVLELSDFLTQGGVLVYFLCRPFVIQGPSLALDNYYWLESLAPDQPAERNVRHMSAVSHGRLIEPTEDGSISEFAPYLLQHGLEWSTLIRTEYLTEGYSVMAEAGSKKCIAGQLFIVESSGKVVFLPSPYSPDFDKTLIDCLNGWYTLKEQSPEELEAEQNEARNASAAAAAAVAPSIGSGLFEKDQSQYEPGSDAPVDTGIESTQSGNYQTTSAPAAAGNEPSFSFSADKIAETVSQDARRFEEEVANRVAREPKKPTTSIDLSIFAQTARQLVQKTEEPAAPQEDVAATPEPVIEETIETSVEEQPEPEAPVEEVEAEAPPPASASQGGGSSLRNLLSAVTPVLPESVKPNMASSASSMLSESDDAEPALSSQQPAAPPPVVKPKSAAALFADDDEFEELENAVSAQESAESAESASEAVEAPEPAVEPQSQPQPYAQSQSDTDTSDQNSGVSQVQHFDNSGVFRQPIDPGLQSPAPDSGVYSTASTDSDVYTGPSDSGVYSAQSDSNSNSYTESTDSGVFQSGSDDSSNNNSGSHSLPESSIYEQPVLETPNNNSGVYSQPQLSSPTSSSSSLPQLGTGSGDFNTVTPAETPAPQPQAQETFNGQPEPPVEPPVQTSPPPQAEPAILQPPSGFMTNFAAQSAPPPVEDLQPAEPPMAQTPVPSVSPAGDNSAVTNNDPSNHENKSTMDLLRELEKAQRPPEQQIRPPLPNPTATAPAPAAEAVRPLLNNLFKKDAAEAPPVENSPPAIPQSAPPAVTHASTPPPQVPTRNTLGALMPAAESRVTVPQENLAMNREGSNAMSNMVVPDWCKQYSFSYLDELKKEQATLASELQDIQAKLNTVESKIASVEQLKAALLSGDGESLKEATGLVLGKLGWTININNATPNEVLLLNVDQPEALVRIVRSDAHCDRSEVAQVSGSAIAFWEKHDIEPKGLLIACTWSNVSPMSRNQKDFEDPVVEFAKKKNLCLITSIQMLGIYRDLELGLVTPDVVRRQMLETNGLLTGYAVEAGAMVGAR